MTLWPGVPPSYECRTPLLKGYPGAEKSSCTLAQGAQLEREGLSSPDPPLKGPGEAGDVPGICLPKADPSGIGCPLHPCRGGGARRERAAQARKITPITLLKGESGSKWMRCNLASLMRQGLSQRSRGALAYHRRFSEQQSLHLGLPQLTLKPHSPGNPELRRRPLPLSCCYGPP